MQLAQKESDEAAEERIDQLKHWGKAGKRLRGRSIDYLVMKQLTKEGTAPGAAQLITDSYPDPETPQQSISTHFYGDHLHWDKEKAAILADRAEVDFFDARSKSFFLTSCLGLAYIYVGYSVLVQAALSGQPPDRRLYSNPTSGQ